jgi:DNA-binding transcriptional LysR family regulator
VAQRWRQLQKAEAGVDPSQDVLAELEFAAVRTHSDTLRILELMHWQHRLRLTVSHFLSLPGIVRSSDLAVLMPRNFAQGFAEAGGMAIIEADLPRRDFIVSMHWSQRFDKDPSLQWLRETVLQLFSSSHGNTGAFKKPQSKI